MKTNRVMLLVLALLIATLIQNAQAFYNPSTGRWLNRDPLEEQDCPNVYAFIHNTPLNKIDSDGRTGWQLPPQLNQDPEFTEGYWQGAGDAALPCLAALTLLTPIPGDEAVAGGLIAKRFEGLLNKCKPCQNFRCSFKILHPPHHYWPAPGNPGGKSYRRHIHIICYDKSTGRKIIDKRFPFGPQYKQPGGHGGETW